MLMGYFNSYSSEIVKVNLSGSGNTFRIFSTQLVFTFPENLALSSREVLAEKSISATCNPHQTQNIYYNVTQMVPEA